MGQISIDELTKVKKFYSEDRLCMREVAEKLGVSIDSVVYFMRKNHIKRRTFAELNKLRFQNKPATFKFKVLNSNYLKELKVIGIMLYWGEGYKSDKGKIVDFANSDPEMISIFLNFLRKIYEIDESKLRILLYCFSNQDQNKLINFWSKLTKISKKQFSKPYIRQDYNSNNNKKMKFGLVHIRYFDKKLLLEIKKAINFYKNKYAGVWEVVKPNGL